MKVRGAFPALCLLQLGIAGCGERVVGPMDGWAFALRSVEGAGLPAEVEAEGGFAWTVVADTIRFTDGDTWRRRTIHLRRLPGAAEERQDLETDGFVSRFEGRIVLDFVCDDTRLAICVPPDILDPDGDTMLMERTAYHAGTNMVFARIR